MHSLNWCLVLHSPLKSEISIIHVILLLPFSQITLTAWRHGKHQLRLHCSSSTLSIAFMMMHLRLCYVTGVAWSIIHVRLSTLQLSFKHSLLLTTAIMNISPSYCSVEQKLEPQIAYKIMMTVTLKHASVFEWSRLSTKSRQQWRHETWPKARVARTVS